MNYMENKIYIFRIFNVNHLNEKNWLIGGVVK